MWPTNALKRYVLVRTVIYLNYAQELILLHNLSTCLYIQSYLKNKNCHLSKIFTEQTVNSTLLEYSKKNNMLQEFKRGNENNLLIDFHTLFTQEHIWVKITTQYSSTTFPSSAVKTLQINLRKNQ